MFNLHNFIFQILLWKMISVFFLWFDYWTLKEWKAAKVQNLYVSGYSLFTLMSGPLRFCHVYCRHVYFFSARFRKMCKLRTTFYLLWQAGPSGLAYYGIGPARLPNWLGMMNARWLDSTWSEIFLQIKFIIFQGCPTKQATFISGQPAPYNQLFIRSVLLVLECYFA